MATEVRFRNGVVAWIDKPPGRPWRISAGMKNLQPSEGGMHAQWAELAQRDWLEKDFESADEAVQFLSRELRTEVAHRSDS